MIRCFAIRTTEQKTKSDKNCLKMVCRSWWSFDVYNLRFFHKYILIITLCVCVSECRHLKLLWRDMIAMKLSSNQKRSFSIVIRTSGNFWSAYVCVFPFNFACNAMILNVHCTQIESAAISWTCKFRCILRPLAKPFFRVK